MTYEASILIAHDLLRGGNSALIESVAEALREASAAVTSPILELGFTPTCASTTEGRWAIDFLCGKITGDRNSFSTQLIALVDKLRQLDPLTKEGDLSKFSKGNIVSCEDHEV